MSNNRRVFLKQLTGLAIAGVSGFACGTSKSVAGIGKKKFFEISLAEWSLHKTLFAKKMDNLDFPVVAKQQYGISIVEYVNQFFKDKAKDTNYLNELLKRCKDNGVTNHLIMCDGEGSLATKDDAARLKAVENHYKWVDAAKYLGCSTIRVNTYGEGTPDEVRTAAVDSLGRLGEYASKENINVVVENHGGLTSNGEWLASVMKQVKKKNVGTLPDLGNFCIKRTRTGCEMEYDRYKGVTEIVPYAKGISAKTNDFDANGNCVETDYNRMMKIIKDSSFKGYIGIEYEGVKLSEDEGIKKTKALLEKMAMQFA
jgi:sugar phosphate isomerase/epimerase